MTNSSAPRPTRRWLPIAIGCVVLLACGLVAVVAAVAFWLVRAQPQASAPTVEYVLDASPRMTEGAAGETRLGIAQGVLAEIVRPADAAVAAGLRVFGTGAQAAVCQDTDLLVPLATASQGRISDQLAALSAGAGADAALADAMVAAIRDLAARPGPHSLVVVTGGADSCNPEAGQLIAQEAARTGIKLELFVVGFQVSEDEAAAIKGVVDQTSGATFLTADDANELRNTLAAIQAHIDRPATTSVANVVATANTVGVLPTAASATAISGPTGVMSLTVLSYQGQPAGVGRLYVEVFSPQDHEVPLSTGYSNPAFFVLAPGLYDVRVNYNASEPNGAYGGFSQQWLTGISIASEETTERTFNLELGEVTLTLLEAAGKPIEDGLNAFAWGIYARGGQGPAVASVIGTGTAILQLPAGEYDILVDFPNTDLNNWEQPDQTFEVQSGQSSTAEFSLHLGRLQIEVVDGAGQPLLPGSFFAYSWPSADPTREFGFSFDANPTDLPLRAGVSYLITLRLEDGRKLDVTDQQVGDGEVKQVTVSTNDFK